jgi:hypothetical protein
MTYQYLHSAAVDLFADIDTANDLLPPSAAQLLEQKKEANQWWQLTTAPGEGKFWLQSGTPHLVLTVSGSSVQAVTKETDDSQYWKQEAVAGTSEFWLIHIDSGLALGVTGTAQSGSPLQALAKANDARQQWSWTPASIATTPSPLGGNSQYILTSETPIQDLVVEVVITEDIVVSPTSSVTPSTPAPLPIGFQINGFSPAFNQVNGDATVQWLQFGAKMWPATNTFVSFAELWPASGPNTINLSAPHPVSLPGNLTIPAGWRIHWTFHHETNGTIRGYDCVVTDSHGAQVDPDMGLDLLDNQPLASGQGNITLADLSQLINVQVVLVGFWSSAQATVVSGAGTITVSAREPLTPTTPPPVFALGQTSAQRNEDGSESFGPIETAENTNSLYSLLPAAGGTSIVQHFAVASVPAPVLSWTRVSNTQGANGGPNFGNTQGDPTGIGDFTEAGTSQVLFFSPGDGNWWLSKYANQHFDWDNAGNTEGANGGPNFGNTQGDPTWTGDFTGSGKSEVLFYSPGDGNWWLANVPATTLDWRTVGNTEGANGGPNFGNTQGDPTWIGRFSGGTKDEVLFYSPGDGNWWLSGYVGAEFAWTQAGNTQGADGGPNFGNTQGDPTWIGDFTGSGKSEVLFFSPGDGNWWLGQYNGSTFGWSNVGNTEGANGGPNFGNTQGDPTWIGRFSGGTKDEVLFYSPGDGHWWHARYAGTQLGWTKAPVANTPAGTIQIGDFTGSGADEVLYYAPGDGDWFVGSYGGGNLNWQWVGNSQGALGGPSFGDTSGDPTWIGTFTGGTKSEVLFYSPGDGNWWLGRIGSVS